ncbi:hypothetical protein BK635_03625 [Pseudomonas chlororaphis]|nr:hypothetical protein BK635_03625 [Pseudomonas chlororaphis]
MAEKMRKRSRKGGVKIADSRNDKALNNQSLVVHKMAEAMGFELMDLLQSTVFKSLTKTSNFNGLWPKVFRLDCVQMSLGTAANGQKLPVLGFPLQNLDGTSHPSSFS